MSHARGLGSGRTHSRHDVRDRRRRKGKSSSYHCCPLLEQLEQRRLLTTLTGQEPLPNSHTAPLTTDISAVFDTDINPATVSAQSFAVHGMQTGQVLEPFDVSGDTVTLSPDAPFQPGELVQATLTSGIESVDGEPLANRLVWQFRAAVSGGSGSFNDSGQSLGDGGRTVAVGDVDGDGDLDALIGNSETNMVWLNDGNGDFGDVGQSFGTSFSGRTITLGDVDGDGDLDAFIGKSGVSFSGGHNEVWLNDGSGSFSDGGQFGSSLGKSVAVSLGDLDGDGDLDAFVANTRQSGWPNKVWLNDGSGTFTDSGQNLGNSRTGIVALGDLDGDGDLDALVGNSPGNDVWLNDGSGTFTDIGQSLGDFGSVALGDLDGDADLDAFVGHSAHQANKVWLNDGIGTFTDSGQSLGEGWSRSVALGDLDGDGDLDAFVGNSPDNNVVWLNDGSGFFVNSGQSQRESDVVALGDVDGDGDLDAFDGNKVWLNQDPLPGDFDNDQDVDGDDFLIWQAGFGIQSGATRYDGDADFDGDVDAVDFRIWQANFGFNGGGTAGGDSAVPAARSSDSERRDSTVSRNEAVDETFAELDRVSARWMKRSLRDELVDKLTLFK